MDFVSTGRPKGKGGLMGGQGLSIASGLIERNVTLYSRHVTAWSYRVCSCLPSGISFHLWHLAWPFGSGPVLADDGIGFLGPTLSIRGLASCGVLSLQCFGTLALGTCIGCRAGDLF